MLRGIIFELWASQEAENGLLRSLASRKTLRSSDFRGYLRKKGGAIAPRLMEGSATDGVALRMGGERRKGVLQSNTCESHQGPHSKSFHLMNGNPNSGWDLPTITT